MAKKSGRLARLGRLGRHAAFQAGVAMLAVAVIAAGWWALGRPDAAAPESEFAEVPPPAVRAVTLEPRDVPLEIAYLGQTVAAERVEIRARVAGFLEERLFEEGALVEAGQPLFEIEREPFEADVAIARARVASAEAVAERARAQMARFRRAEERGAATETEIEEQETELRVAEAEVAHARAQLDKAQLELGYTMIASPIAGRIGQALEDVGSYVGPGEAGLLAVVEQVDPIDVTFTVSEREILRSQRMIAEGAIAGPSESDIRVRVTLSDGVVYPEHGRIDFIGVRIDPATSTTLVRAVVPNPRGELRPGQFVHITPLGFVRRNAIVAPKTAVVQSPTGASVYVIDEHGVAQTRPVELGDWTEAGWVVVSGLEAGERIVSDGIVRVRPGAPVRVVGPEEDMVQGSGASGVSGDGTGSVSLRESR